MSENERRIVSNKPKNDLDISDESDKIYGHRIKEAIERSDINNIDIVMYLLII